jgi:hypothetical protein
VLLSLIYRLIRSLLGFLAVVARSDVSKDVELLVLRQENQVLRRQVRGRPRWDDADRLLLAALSRLAIAVVGLRSSLSPRRRSCAGTVIWSPVSGRTPTGADREDPAPVRRSRH